MNQKHFLKIVVLVISVFGAQIQGIPVKSHKELFQSQTLVKNEELCTLCDVAAAFVSFLVKENKTAEIEKFVGSLCVELKISPFKLDISVCHQAIAQYKDQILDIARDSKLLPTEFCSVVLNCGPVTNPILDWNVTLPNTQKPPVIPPKLPKPDSPKLRILHLSDIHIDYEYAPGSVGDCGQPLCCRNSSTPYLDPATNKPSNSSGAGYWGDYRNCDLPIWTAKNMFDYIAKNEQFDMVYWTGDIPPHNVWNQSSSDQLNSLSMLSILFSEYFPANTIIYPALGNHEATPCNLFPTPAVTEDSPQWLYEVLAEEWVQYGLPDSLVPNITAGAFYTVVVRPGLRIISLNTNYCAELNWWLFVNSTDPLGQFVWLMSVLQQSENIGEKVHIIGHINPSGCLDSYSKNYYRIVNRYESTIVGQFFGHTHFDEIEIFYDEANLTRATNVAYVTGSATTYNYLNPGYKIYVVDGDYNESSYQVLDHENTFMNITQSNLLNVPTWTKGYTAKNEYNMTSLFAQDWSNLVDRVLNNLDDPLFDKIYKNFFKSSDATDAHRPCDHSCRKEFICRFKQARADSFYPC